MDWDTRFVELADVVAGWSKDPSTKVGCVIVRPDRTIASVGFNGFPRGVSDDEALYADRDIKIPRVIHAETNAVLNAHEPVRGCTAYVTHPPCMSCTGILIQAGISTIVWKHPSEAMKSRWGEQFHMSKGLLAEAGVDYIEV